MMRIHDQEITLSGPVFRELREEADKVLRAQIANMLENCLDTGETVIKIRTELKRDRVADPYAGDGAKREILVPSFSFAVCSIFKQQIKKDGTVSGNYEILYDPDTDTYIRRPIEDAQTSLFDAATEDGAGYASGYAGNAYGSATGKSSSGNPVIPLGCGSSGYPGGPERDTLTAAELVAATGIAYREGQLTPARLRQRWPGMTNYRAELVIDTLREFGIHVDGDGVYTDAEPEPEQQRMEGA